MIDNEHIKLLAEAALESFEVDPYETEKALRKIIDQCSEPISRRQKLLEAERLLGEVADDTPNTFACSIQRGTLKHLRDTILDLVPSYPVRER